MRLESGVMGKIWTFKDLMAFQKAYGLAMEIFQLTKGFPKEETYSLTDQIRRSSRSVAANLAEAYKRRIYPKMFISKIVDCEAEGAETQVWIMISHECKYLDSQTADRLFTEYDQVLSLLVYMRNHPEKWI
jgi:four helix bundle protein